MKRRPKLKQKVKDALGIAAFYLLIVLGVIAINARMEQLNGEKNSADVVAVQTAQSNR